MLGIKFIERSLLLGYSVHWIIISTVFPTLDVPSVRNSKSPHIFDKIPFLKRLLKREKSPAQLWSSHRYSVFLFRTIRVCQLALFTYYYLMLLIFGIRVQERIMRAFGFFNAETLAYKALYYTPLLHVSSCPPLE